MSNGQQYMVRVTDPFANTIIVYDGKSSTAAYEKFEEECTKIGTRYTYVEIAEVLESRHYSDGE